MYGTPNEPTVVGVCFMATSVVLLSAEKRQHTQ